MLNKNICALAGLVILNYLPVFSQNLDSMFSLIKRQHNKIEHVHDKVYSMTNMLTGKVRLWNFGERKMSPRYQQGVIIDSIVINPHLIDTLNNKFSYSLWSGYDFFGWNAYDFKMLFNDYNRNNKTEIFTFKSNPVHPVEIVEIDSAKKNTVLFTYPAPARFPLAQYDIDGDAGTDLILNTDGSRGVFVYSSSDTNFLPVKLKLFFTLSPDVQVDNIYFDDLDNNGKCDLLFTIDREWGGVIIYEYDKDTNNFVPAFNYRPTSAWEGYAIGDFDNDSKKEIVYSTQEEGIVNVIEAQGAEHTYSHIFEYHSGLANAHHQMKTNDIDGNGRSEFWIGGNDFITPFSYTLICFESDSNNSYSIKKKIIFLNHFGLSFSKIFPVDIDNNGNEEIFVGLDNSVYLLSYSKKDSKYNIEYYKKMQFNSSGDFVTDVNFYDLFHSGKKDMLVSWIDSYGNEPLQYFDKTDIYRIDKLTSVPRTVISRASEFDLQQNFPNPFNSTTIVRFSVLSQSDVSIIVSDVLGREVKTLVNSNYQTGRYEVRWDGKDTKAEVASGGVYFITFRTNKLQKTIKTLFIK